MKHIRYIRYIAIHKWFVMLACFRRGLIWQGLIHDWSKFLPSEWLPYAESFYGDGRFKHEQRMQAINVLGHDPFLPEYVIRDRFDRAWLAHQHRNPHHWQHWVLREDSGKIKVLEMPVRYAVEMVCDWEGAGRAITGKLGGTQAWYLKNAHNIQLHPETLKLVAEILDIAPGYCAFKQAGG